MTGLCPVLQEVIWKEKLNACAHAKITTIHAIYDKPTNAYGRDREKK
jgi:hypothetical protein